MSTNKKKTEDISIADFWGENLITFYFSSKGFFHETQYLWSHITLFTLFQFVNDFGSITSSFLVYLFLFYSTTLATQKRCRDIGFKGTFFILCNSFYDLMNYYHIYIETHNLDRTLWRNSGKISAPITILFLATYLFLIFCSGKPEKDANLTSPLIKHPIIYFGFWSVLFLLFRWWLKNYYGI